MPNNLLHCVEKICFNGEVLVTLFNGLFTSETRVFLLKGVIGWNEIGRFATRSVTHTTSQSGTTWNNSLKFYVVKYILLFLKVQYQCFGHPLTNTNINTWKKVNTNIYAISILFFLIGWRSTSQKVWIDRWNIANEFAFCTPVDMLHLLYSKVATGNLQFSHLFWIWIVHRVCSKW